MKEQSNVDRAHAILQYIARHPGEHGVRALSAALDISPSTVFRLLDSLVRAGFVRQNETTSRYTIGVQAVQLGIAAIGTFDLTNVVPPYLHALVTETGESAFLAVPDDGEMVYLLKQEGVHSIRTTAVLGTRRPVHCTALGKSFLSTLPPAEVKALLERKGMPGFTRHTITDMARMWEELAQVRLSGYAVDREEVEDGLMCLAAPIRDYKGEAVAAVSLAGPVGRILPHEERYGRRIAATAREVSLALGYIPQQLPKPQVEIL